MAEPPVSPRSAEAGTGGEMVSGAGGVGTGGGDGGETAVSGAGGPGARSGADRHQARLFPEVVFDPAEFAGRFSTALGQVGVPVPPDRAVRLVAALELLAPLDRDRLYWAARLSLLGGREHLAAFDALFARLFGAAPGPAPGPIVTPAPSDATRVELRPPVGGLLGAVGWSVAAVAGRTAAGDGDERGRHGAAIPVASREEALATRDFATMDEEEAAAAAALSAALEVATPWRPGRRHQPHHGGRRVDLRRTLRAAARRGGDPVRLVERRRMLRRRPLVLLCDTSASMEPYTRAYLQFFHGAAAGRVRAEAFVFATRLTRLTPVLRTAGADAALSAAGILAPDWSGGTRIGAALAEFNDSYGRRGMARGAVIVVFSDGWERDDPAAVGREMSRLKRLAYRVVWVNPRKAAPGYSPLTGGMAAALPSVDFFVSGHTVAALAEVIQAIAGSVDTDGKLGGGAP